MAHGATVTAKSRTQANARFSRQLPRNRVLGVQPQPCLVEKILFIGVQVGKVTSRTRKSAPRTGIALGMSSGRAESDNCETNKTERNNTASLHCIPPDWVRVLALSKTDKCSVAAVKRQAMGVLRSTTTPQTAPSFKCYQHSMRLRRKSSRCHKFTFSIRRLLAQNRSRNP
jgi:hypothetical protein